jgi:predicted Rdx family selenoprotein
LEEELIERFGAEVELIAGSGGVFDVVADGKKIFSKAAVGRFPEDGEIIKFINSAF